MMGSYSGEDARKETLSMAEAIFYAIEKLTKQRAEELKVSQRILADLYHRCFIEEYFNLSEKKGYVRRN